MWYDEEQEGYDEYSTRSTYKRRKHVTSEPSPHVIFLGLDQNFNEEDVSALICLFYSPLMGLLIVISVLDIKRMCNRKRYDNTRSNFRHLPILIYTFHRE